MTDFADPSTVIDTDPAPSAAGGGQVPIADPEAKTPTVREDLEHAFKLDDRRKADAEAKAAKPEEKPAEEPKDEAKEEIKDAKPAKDEPAPKESKAEEAQKPEESEQTKAEQREAKRNIEPPAKMLPRAKELWRNTPREVQAEIERITREHDEFASQARASTERYDQIRQFDELAKSNGLDLRESLTRINAIENMMQRNPIAGLNAILQEIGPKKADGQSVSLFEVAQHIVSQGQHGYQQIVAQGQPQPEQREDPRVVELQQQIEKLEIDHIHATVIEPFKADHPRYDELEGHIASFLNSDMIPRSLSAADRLAAAYDMAVRINPVAHFDPPAPERSPAPDRRADEDFSGSRSIKSAPGGVTEQFEDEAKPGESIRDSLRAVVRRRA